MTQRDLEGGGSSAPLPPLWAKVIDHTSCIGCHACTTACKSENQVPVGVTRTYVKSVDIGVFPQARRAFQVTRCNQCEDSPCTTACPTHAMYRREDGIVDFDKDACIGCKACMAACPYDAIFINPEDHTAEKCNFCAHRLDVGLEPACVTVCPAEAILVGDLNDPSSRVAEIAQRSSVAVRRPEKATRPKLFYRGAHQATLDPLAARRPEGGLFMWSEQQEGAGEVVSGHPDTQDGPTSSAAALLSYDVRHTAPWDWRVSLYTLTKGIAAGAYLVPALLVLGGLLSAESSLWQLWAPLTALVFLAVTGAVLISDLEKPKRFYYIFIRPQWRSWLVRGAFIIAAYGAVLSLHLALAAIGQAPWLGALAFAGIPLAIATAVYTAYLFAQAKARDLWQSPLLPPHLLVQSVMAGAAFLLLIVPAAIFAQILAAATLAHLLMILGEVTLPHVTAHARLASWEMTKGRYRNFYLAGLALGATALAAPILGSAMLPFVALLSLAGLLSYEHAYVQAGQAVPLA